MPDVFEWRGLSVDDPRRRQKEALLQLYADRFAAGQDIFTGRHLPWIELVRDDLNHHVIENLCTNSPM